MTLWWRTSKGAFSTLFLAQALTANGSFRKQCSWNSFCQRQAQVLANAVIEQTSYLHVFESEKHKSRWTDWKQARNPNWYISCGLVNLLAWWRPHQKKYNVLEPPYASATDRSEENLSDFGDTVFWNVMNKGLKRMLWFSLFSLANILRNKNFGTQGFW